MRGPVSKNAGQGIRLPLVGDVPWPWFSAATLGAPPLFIVGVWLFFTRVPWHAPESDRALFVTLVSVAASLVFAAVLLRAIGSAYARLSQAAVTMHRQNLQLRALHAAGLALGKDHRLGAVLTRIEDLSRHVLNVRSARVTIEDPDGGEDRPASAPDSDEWDVPIRFRNRPLGVLRLRSRPGMEPGAEDRETAERFAAQAGAAIANAQLLEAVRQLGATAERERIGRDLHDGTLQSLYGLSLELRAALLDPDATREDLAGAIEHSLDGMAGVLSDVRAYVTQSARAARQEPDLERTLR